MKRWFLSFVLVLALLAASPVAAQNAPAAAAAAPPAAAPAPAPASPPPLPTAQSLAQDVQNAITQPAAPTKPEVSTLDKAQIQKLLSTLQSPKDRDAFIANLKGMLSVSDVAQNKKPLPPGERALDAVSKTVTDLGKNFSLIGKGFADLPQTSAWLKEQLETPEGRDRWFRLLSRTFLALAAGSLVFFLVRFLLRRPREMLAKMPSLSFPARLLVFGSYHFLALMPVLTFTVTSLFTLQTFELPKSDAEAAASVLYAFIILQLCMWVLRMVFASRAPSRRLLPMDDETAAYLYVWLVRLSGMIIFGAFLSRAALILEIPESVVHAFASLMGLIVTLMVIIIVLQNRTHVAAWLRGDHDIDADGKKETRKEKQKKIFLLGLRQHLAGVWHVLAIIYLAVGYLVATLDVENGFAVLTRATVITVLVLLGFHFFLRGIDRLMVRGFALPTELKRQFPRLEERTNSYLPILQRVLKLAVWGVGLVVLLSAWGLDTVGWFAQPGAQKVFSAVISIAITLFLAVLVWEVVGSIVERYLRGEQRDGRRIERSGRIRTLLPLARYTVQILLVIVAGVIILSEVGVNTAPFLAGAGIIGLAIGFGAQALVKDVIGGLFILMEDIIAVGDIVKMGDHSGVVEGLTIRTVKLRDSQGYVHSVPFGELTSIVNMTRHFARVVVEIPVAFDSDWRKVMQIMRDVTEEMRKEEAFQKAIYEPMEMLGIDRYESSWAVIMARIKTQPLQQWNVKREYLLRLKERLDREGVVLPYQVSMNFPMSMIEDGEAPKTPRVPKTAKTPVTPEIKAKAAPVAETKDQAKALKNLDEANPPPSKA